MNETDVYVTRMTEEIGNTARQVERRIGEGCKDAGNKDLVRNSCERRKNGEAKPIQT